MSQHSDKQRDSRTSAQAPWKCWPGPQQDSLAFLDSPKFGPHHLHSWSHPLYLAVCAHQPGTPILATAQNLQAEPLTHTCANWRTRHQQPRVLRASGTVPKLADVPASPATVQLPLDGNRRRCPQGKRRVEEKHQGRRRRGRQQGEQGRKERASWGEKGRGGNLKLTREK